MNTPPQAIKTATALRFIPGEDTAPVVMAAGEGATAEAILQVAEEHGITIYKDPALARALGALEVGDLVPPGLYEAVSEILSYVYTVDERYQQQCEPALGGMAAC